MTNWLKDRVESRLQALGLGPIEAASNNGAGLQRDYIDNIVKGKKRSVRSDGATKLSVALEAPVEYFLFENFDGTSSQKSDHEHSAYGTKLSGDVNHLPENSPLQQIRATHTVTIKGKVTAGIWRAMKEYDQDLGSFLFNAPKLKGKRLYGLMVEGNSVNLRFPSGTIVVIAGVYDRRPKNKDFVVIRNYVAVDIAETTLKQAIAGPDGVVRYYCCSDDPEYRDAPPIVIPPRDEFAQLGYEVIGSVVGEMPRLIESDEEELDI